jgi:hypothetical protein
MKRVLVLGALTTTVMLLAACGGGSDSADQAKLDRRDQALDRREKQLDERDRNLSAATTTTAPAATTTTAPSPYPREIPIDQIKDQRIRGDFQMHGAATAVELAPGVYAEKGQGPVGPADRYTTVVGLCADVNAYEQVHGQRGHSCW